MNETSEDTCADYVKKLNISFRSGKTLSYAWRLSQLQSLKLLVKENEKAIIEALGTDLGKRKVPTPSVCIRSGMFNTSII